MAKLHSLRSLHLSMPSWISLGIDVAVNQKLTNAQLMIVSLYPCFILYSLAKGAFSSLVKFSSELFPQLEGNFVHHISRHSSFKSLQQTHLLQFKDMFVEIELKLLICKVDAELFKTVMLVIFKSKNVQNSYRASLKSTSSCTF